MNHERVRKARRALDAAREAYCKAAEELLAAAEATDKEIEEADNIINRDIETTGGPLPQDWLGYEENLACTILDEVRCKQ